MPVKRSAAKRKTATDVVSSLPIVSDYEYSDSFPAIPVVFLSASDTETEGHAIACNKRDMVRITTADGRADVPLARIVTWRRKFLLEIDGLGTLSQEFTVTDFQPLDNGLEVGNRVSIVRADIKALIGKIGTIQEVIELGDEPEPFELKSEIEPDTEESSELSKVEPIDELTEITTQINSLYSEANAAEQVCIDAGKSALFLTFELGAKLQQAKELVGHGNWLPWLEERQISDDKAKRAIRLHKHRDDLEAVLKSGSLPDLTPNKALQIISAKRDEEAPKLKPESQSEPEEKHSFEEVSELFKPWGELTYNAANRKLLYTFDRPGHSAGFRNLKEAVAYHLRSCREDNKLEARQNQEPSDLGTVPFYPAPTVQNNSEGAEEEGQLEDFATDESRVPCGSDGSDRLEDLVTEVKIPEPLSENPIHSTTQVLIATGNDEQYTPEKVWQPGLECFEALEFDLDPTSYIGSPIPTASIFTKGEDALTKAWVANTLWSNFPYSSITPMVDKLLAEIDEGNVRNALTLVKCDCRTLWFQKLLDRSQAHCLIQGGLKFITPENSEIQNNSGSFFGSVVFYFGQEVDRFYHAYRHLGVVCQAINPEMFGE